MTLAVTSTKDPSFPAGWQRQFDDVDSRIVLTQRSVNTTVEANASKLDGSDGVTVGFSPRAGEQLHEGTYRDVTPGSGGTIEGPTFELDVHGVTNGSEFNDVTILDLAADTDGTIIRLDLTFVTQPRTAAGSYFGELRIGEPPSALSVSSPHVALPDYVTHAKPLPVTERLRNTGQSVVKVTSVVAAGGDVTDVSLTADTCTGARLRPKGSCTVVVAYAPRGIGPRRVSLHVNSTDTAAGTSATNLITLSGPVLSGRTTIVTYGNDFIDEGQRIESRQGPYQLDAYFNQPNLLGLRPTIYGPQGWGNNGIANVSVQIQPPRGSTITTGRHTTAPNGWDVNVSGFGRGCDVFGALTVHDIAFDTAGHLTRADISFQGPCGTPTGGVIHGHVVYREP